jgi:hypothetical protein
VEDLWEEQKATIAELIAVLGDGLGNLRFRKDEVAESLLAAHVSRCRRLLETMQLLQVNGLHDVLGLPLRSLVETWMATMLLGLEGDAGYERLVKDYMYWRRRLAEDFGLNVREDVTKRGRSLPTKNLVEIVEQSLLKAEEPLFELVPWLHSHVYAGESLRDVHGRLGVMRRYVKQVGEERHPILEGRARDDGRGQIVSAAALTAILGRTVFGWLGLSVLEIDRAARVLPVPSHIGQIWAKSRFGASG